MRVFFIIVVGTLRHRGVFCETKSCRSRGRGTNEAVVDSFVLVAKPYPRAETVQEDNNLYTTRY